MNITKRGFRTRTLTTFGVIAVVGIWGIASAGMAQAASVQNGPIGLGTAQTYGTLAGSAITNTGPTTVNGDLGVSPGSSISGFTGAPDGTNVGAVHDNDAAALQAQNDLTTAYNNAAGLTPSSSGLAELSGMSLTPGVYSGGALSLSDNGTLTLAGTSASSIWVFQAASSLTIGSATHIIITGGATACNVFWQVGSSASIGTSAQFVGTVMAAQSITAATGATISGRLLASSAAVTLENNTITVPTGCAAGTAPTTVLSPVMHSTTVPTAEVGTPYSFGLGAAGSPAPTLSITSGALPQGLTFNSTTGMITGTPTITGTSTFTITASNGVAPNAAVSYSLVTAGAALASTGVDPAPALIMASILLTAGGLLIAARRRQSSTTTLRKS
jgi:LPXTG-motif cell wall-anchored protein